MLRLKKTMLVCSGLLIGFMGNAAYGAMIASDSFVVGTGAYTAAAINTQNPPVTGFSGAWVSSSTAWTVGSTGLAHAKATWATGGRINWGGTTSTGFNRQIERTLAPYTPSNTYYFSALASRTSWADNLDENVAGWTNDAENEGFEFGYDRFSGTTPDFIVRTGGTAGTVNVVSNGESTFGRTYLVIAKLEVNYNETADRLSYWISGQTGTAATGYDISSEEALNASTLTSGVDYRGVLTGEFISNPSAITQWGVNTPNAAGPVQWDEVRMGTTYYDAVPVPEPTTASLLLIGGTALCLRRRRS